MAQVLLLRGARQLLTLRGSGEIRRGAALHDLAIIEDGSVLIKDGLIAAVGTTRRIENLKEARTAIEIPVSGAVVMPGFIDPNLQLGIEGSSEDSEQSRKRRVMAEFYEGTLALMRSCLQYGTLTVAVKAQSRAVDPRSSMALFRQLAHIGSNPVEMTRTWRLLEPPAPDERVDESLRNTLAQLLQRKLAQGIEPAVRSDQPVNHGLWETAAEVGATVNLSWRAGGSSERLREMIAASRAASVCTTPDLSEAECSVLAGAPAMVVVSPGRETLQGNGLHSVQRLIETGAAVALSSGYHFSDAPTFSMQMVIALAVFRLGLTTEQAIVASTINAAHAVGRADVVGSLEFGKRADIIALNVPDYREIPRRFGINHVGIVIRDGNLIFNRMRAK